MITTTASETTAPDVTVTVVRDTTERDALVIRFGSHTATRTAAQRLTDSELFARAAQGDTDAAQAYTERRDYHDALARLTY